MSNESKKLWNPGDDQETPDQLSAEAVKKDEPKKVTKKRGRPKKEKAEKVEPGISLTFSQCKERQKNQKNKLFIVTSKRK